MRLLASEQPHWAAGMGKRRGLIINVDRVRFLEAAVVPSATPTETSLTRQLAACDLR
ncbi:MAG TPA: hypothetical protein VEB21_09665 [Terriglobales bacterium]|nr:hypothetical protein [Terriglobales bacterium]